MQKFIVRINTNPIFTGLYETNDSLHEVFLSLENGWYDITKYQCDDSIPIFDCGYITSEPDKYLEEFNDKYSLIEENVEFTLPQRYTSNTINLERLEFSQEDADDFEAFLKANFSDCKIYKEEHEAYVGASGGFMQYAIEVASALSAVGIIEIIRYLKSRNHPTNKIDSIEPRDFLKYLEDNYNVNPHSIKLISTTLMKSGNIKFKYLSGRTEYYLEVNDEGKIINSNENRLTQTNI